MTNQQGRCVVVGSINVDYVSSVLELPAPGETVLSLRQSRRLGGKGANQAVAARRFGAAVVLVGNVGADDDADFALEQLSGAGVVVDAVTRVPNASTGRALLAVDQHGENSIVVSSGANAVAPLESEVLKSISPQDIVILQGEISPEVIDAVSAQAAHRGARVVLNLAPVVDVDPDTLRRANPLIVNEVEAAALLAVHVDGRSEATTHARILELVRLSQSVVITRGSEGAMLCESGMVTAFSAVPVEVVDTTGAGDAFVGTLAGAMMQGVPLEEAVGWAMAAATASVRSEGAADSYLPRAKLTPVHVPGRRLD